MKLAFKTRACTDPPRKRPKRVCFMCKSTDPKPDWIQASFEGSRWFCSKYCHYHYAMGSDIT